MYEVNVLTMATVFNRMYGFLNFNCIGLMNCVVIK